MKYGNSRKILQSLKVIKKAADKECIKFWILGGLACAFHVGKIYRDHGDIDVIVRNSADQIKISKLIESIGFNKIKEKKLTGKVSNFVYENSDGVEIEIGHFIGKYGMVQEDFEEDEKEIEGVKCRVVSKRYLINFIKKYKKNNIEVGNIDLKYLGEINEI